jgi:hypothetical protein
MRNWHMDEIWVDRDSEKTSVRGIEDTRMIEPENSDRT